MTDYTGLDQGTTPLVRPYVPAYDPGDPGPVPEMVEPAPSSVVLVVGAYTSVDVTRNVGRTGLTGLTVTRGESSVTVALPPATVDALLRALAEATSIPYLITTRDVPGGDRR